jgi:hypothetical protein
MPFFEDMAEVLRSLPHVSGTISPIVRLGGNSYAAGLISGIFMPRNDQVTRQWHVLRLLESSRGLTLDELMQELPDDYPRHPRTLRLDLGALEMAGFPLGE